MRIHHPFSDGAWVCIHVLGKGSVAGSAAVVSSLHMCPPIDALSCSFCRSSSHQMKALGRVFVSSAVGGLLGAAAFFPAAVEAKSFWGGSETKSYGERFELQCLDIAAPARTVTGAGNDFLSKANGSCNLGAEEYQKQQDGKGWVGLVSGGPLGAFVAPMAFEWFGRNVWAWTIVGVFVGPFLWLLQIFGFDFLVARAQESKT